jgi:hypothetical protein
MVLMRLPSYHSDPGTPKKIHKSRNGICPNTKIPNTKKKKKKNRRSAIFFFCCETCGIEISYHLLGYFFNPTFPNTSNKQIRKSGSGHKSFRQKSLDRKSDHRIGTFLSDISVADQLFRLVFNKFTCNA